MRLQDVPKTAVIVFNLEYLNRFTPARKEAGRFKKVHLWNCTRYGTARVAMRKGAMDKAEDIDWDKLPERFVLKCNHGCAYNIVVSDKNKLDKAETVKQLNDWLKEDFGAFNIEIHYSAIKHHVITCEEFLGENITDYKFFCFNGEPHCIYVSTDMIDDRQAQIGFSYLDGKKMPLHRDDYTDIPEVTLPSFYDEMKKAAEVLCKDVCTC